MGRRGQKSRSKPEPHVELHRLAEALLKITIAPPEKRISDHLRSAKAILDLLNQIRAIEDEQRSVSHGIDLTDATGGAPTNAAAIDAFLAWLHENGATFENLAVAHFPGYGLGLRATDAIATNASIIEIPRSMMMTVEDARASTLNALAKKDALLKNMDTVLLSVFLLLEKCNHTSFWRPYLDLLPTRYGTVLYFTYEELVELEGSPALEETLKHIRNIARQYAYLYTLIWKVEDPVCKTLRRRLTFEQYRWAASTVMTRNNTIPSDLNADEVVMALIPLWDLCNHKNGRISTGYNPELKRSICYAMEDFEKDQQVFIFYGARRNDQFFLHNAFVYEDNEFDAFAINLGISKNDPLKHLREELLDKLAIMENWFLLRRGNEPIDGNLLAFLRIFSMSQDQLQQWLKDEQVQNLISPQYYFDLDYEKKCWDFFLMRLKLLQGVYKTSLDEDKQLLNTSNLSDHKTMIVRLRIAEKLILQNAEAYIKNRLENLEHKNEK